MFGRIQTEALVVGAGPAGLLAALQLVENEVAVEIIDEQWRPAGHSYALALHPASLHRLDRLGLAQDAVAQGRQVPTMSLYEGLERGASIPLGGGDARFPFVLSLPQSALESLLVARLEKRGVRVRWNHRFAGMEVGENGVVARVERLAKESAGYAVAHTTWVVDKTLEIRASYVVGADGHRSMVRRTLGIPFEEIAPSQAFAVFEYEVRRAAADEMRLVLGASTVDVLWPLPGQWARWSLELLAPEVEAADRFKSRLTTRLGERFFHRLDEAQLAAILRERPSWFDPTFEDLGWSIEVRFERRLAGTIGRDRVWLAGDAAHLTGPAGMQSMNAGLREAGELATCIARILRGKEDPGVLADYERRTLAEWRFLLGSAGGLRPGASTPPFIATNAARVLACLPGTGEEIDRLAGHLGLTADRG